MSLWFRVTQNKNKLESFSGDGGLYTAGRWNHKGRKVVYCSASFSLCTLEWLSHNGLSVSSFNYFKYSIEIPDSLIQPFKCSDLPKDWFATPANDETHDFADKYLFLDKKNLAIAVPSVMVPEEYNLVINPLHPKYALVSDTIKFHGQFIAPVR